MYHVSLSYGTDRIDADIFRQFRYNICGSFQRQGNEDEPSGAFGGIRLHHKHITRDSTVAAVYTIISDPKAREIYNQTFEQNTGMTIEEYLQKTGITLGEP